MKFKKIILLFLLCMTFSAFKLKSHAKSLLDLTKPLVIRLGSDYTDFVKFEGFTIVSNTINVNVEGKYKLVYTNNQTNEEYTKDVYVTLDNAFYFENFSEQHKDENYKFELIDSIKLNNQNFNLVKFTGGRYKTNNYVLSSNGVNTTIRLNTKSEMKDIESVNGEVFIVGTGYNDMNNDPDLHYATYKKDVVYQKIESTDPEYASCITGNDKYVFIGGYTNKCTDLFPLEKNLNDAFLVVVERNTNNIISKKVFTSLNNDYLVDIKLKDNYLYAILENETNNFKVIKLDIFGNVLKEKELKFDYGYNCPSFKLIDNQLYLNYYYYDYAYLDDCEVIEVVDENLEMKRLYFNYSDRYILKDYDIINGNILTILYGYRNGSSGYLVKVLENENVLLTKEINSYLIPLRINNNFITFSYDNAVLVNEFNTLILKDTLKTQIDPKEKDNVILDYNLLINGKKVTHSDKSNLEIDVNLFGAYQLDYYFEDHFDYLYTNRIDYLPFVGVLENGVYDIGVTLNGNAIVRVNGNKVDLPYKIDQEGIYKVELLGQNNISIEFNIVVKKMTSVNENVESKETLMLDIGKNQLLTESSVDVLVNKEKKQQRNNYFYLYLIPILTGCIGYVLIKRV